MMYGPIRTLRITADSNAALPAQAHVHGMTIFNGTTSAAASLKAYDRAAALKLIAAQTNANYDNSPTTEGTFVAGSGYGAGNTITLSDGSLITVDTVTAGAVATFTVTTAGTSGVLKGTALTQSSTSGSGTGFTLTADLDNVEDIAGPTLEIRSETVTATLWRTQTDIKYPRPISFLVAVSLALAGTSAVGYVHYTL